jgi:antagonist of KipI
MKYSSIQLPKMSLQITKTGLLDTIQDTGRYGYQDLGVNPAGAMDRFSAQAANALLGKDLSSPVIEMHFPSPKILFQKETVICITGADFTPIINNKKIPLGQPVVVNKETELSFDKKISGGRCYLSILHDFEIDKWLNSYSTNLVAGAGGYKGRQLKKGDIIEFIDNPAVKLAPAEKDFVLLPWRSTESISLKKEIRFLKGNEWGWLTEAAFLNFTTSSYQITKNSDRMGYRLTGGELKVKENRQLISSGVTFGTVQLLPEGQLIVLMADHQTTGGYPRIAHVISADLPLLAQCEAGEEIKFIAVEHTIGEQEIVKQQRDLLHMQTASKFKMENLLNGS